MRVYHNFQLQAFNSYRIRSVCQRAFFFDSEDEIEAYFQENPGNKFILLGSGHNVILSKERYEEDFIIFSGNFDRIVIDDTKVIAEAGVFTSRLCEAAHGAGLSGIEIFYDIPSSLGGAVVMNAGASGEEIKDVLVKVRYLDLEDHLVKNITVTDMGFEYRNSFFQRHKNKIVLKAWLQLTKKDPNEIWSKMVAVKSAREAKQPKEFPNAGSVFKRPKGFFVGAMIDELNLKGFTVGGAKISEKHGGFIVNFDNATGRDIVAIINEVKARVSDRFKVDLEVEQRII